MRPAATIEHYDYRLDPTGRKVGAETWQNWPAGTVGWTSAPAGATPARIAETTWQRHVLFGSTNPANDVVSYQVAEERAWTCGGEATAAACRATGALLRTVHGWGPLFAGSAGTQATAEPDWVVMQNPAPPPPLPAKPMAMTGISIEPARVSNVSSDVVIVPGLIPPPRSYLCGEAAPTPLSPTAVMFVECGQRVTEVPGKVTTGDRGAIFSHALVHEDLSYRLLPTEARRYQATGDAANDTSWGTVKAIARSRTVYDASQRVPSEQHLWLDDFNVAVTCMGHDMATGNVTSVKKPNQAVLVTTIGYDSFKLYPLITTNELGQQTQTTFDLATGLPLFQSDVYQPGRGDWPGQRLVYDGFGRVTRTYRKVDRAAGTGTYEEKLVAQANYFDAEVPNRVRSQNRIDYDGTRWVTTEATIDGFGRVLSETAVTDVGAAVTRYTRDTAGNLIKMVAPNPSALDGATVEHRWAHDSLGRVTLATPPPIAAPVEISYRGLITTRRDLAPVGGTPSQTELSHDVFGRLRTVVETRTTRPRSPPMNMTATTSSRSSRTPTTSRPRSCTTMPAGARRSRAAGGPGSTSTTKSETCSASYRLCPRTCPGS